MLEKPAYYLAFVTVVTLVLIGWSRIVRRVVDRSMGPMRQNGAYALLEAGRVVGIFSISAKVVTDCVHGLSVTSDILWVSVFGLSSVILLETTAKLGVYLLIRGHLPKQIAEGNVAAGLAGGAQYAATGIIIARCMAGDSLSSFGTSFVFFVIAKVTLHLLLAAFRFVTRYDDGEEIVNENVAAAVSYAGATIALGLIIGNAVSGDFEGWRTSLRGYAISVVFALGLFPVRKVIVEGLFLRQRGLDAAVATERNVGLAGLEAAAYVGTAFLLNAVR
jgi:uncharacterized membrane protein YjfL (UPF0719 family)